MLASALCVIARGSSGRLLLSRNFSLSSNVRESVRSRLARISRPSVKESIKGAANGPSTGAAFEVGRIGLGIASAVGIGALCLYGMSGPGAAMSTAERSIIWPDYVRQRIHSTYAYFGASLATTAASAIALFRSPRFMRIIVNGGWVTAIGMTVLAIGSGVVCRAIDYTEHGLFNGKHLAWLIHCGTMGGMLAPVCILGGPLILRAALYTSGIVGGLSLVAMSAPSDKFLYMGGPLAMGLGVVFISSIGSMFLSPATALGAGLYSISLYGGLVLFSGFMLYDTQHVVHRAETHPPPELYGVVKSFDPINNSIGIFLDTINIFIRIVTILSGGGSKRK